MFVCSFQRPSFFPLLTSFYDRIFDRITLTIYHVRYNDSPSFHISLKISLWESEKYLSTKDIYRMVCVLIIYWTKWYRKKAKCRISFIKKFTHWSSSSVEYFFRVVTWYILMLHTIHCSQNGCRWALSMRFSMR